MSRSRLDRRPGWLALAAATALLVLAASNPGDAHARSERELSYPYERAWPAAVRFLRIDEGFSIVERDADIGYVVFELKEDGRTFSGSLEVVRTEDDEGRKAVRFVLRIPNRPTYVESGILERLARKLRTDYGDPEPVPEPEPAPPKKGEEQPPDDAKKGDDKGEKEGSEKKDGEKKEEKK